MSATTTQLFSSGQFCKICYDTIPVKSASANVYSVPISQKYQILSCDTLIADERSIHAGPSGRAAYGISLRPFACWDCGFESHQRHRCLCVVSVGYCQVEVSATADHSSRGVLPTVVCRCLWSINLFIEEALAHWGAVAPKRKKERKCARIGKLKGTALMNFKTHEACKVKHVYAYFKSHFLSY